VERGIPYCREDFFRGESFRDVAEMQARALVWCRDVAGTRVHGTTRQVPRVVFETTEQAALQPLAPEPFDRPAWAWATVHPDHHIQFRRALYSVPTRYLRQRVEVRGDSRLVRIYHHGALIKVHAPQPPGGRSTDYTDYPAERAAYAMRAPEACVRQAEQVGPAVGQFVHVLLSGTFPWARLRQAQKLLRLAERYGAGRVTPAAPGPWPSSCWRCAAWSGSCAPRWNASPAPPNAAPSAPCRRALPARPRALPITPARRSPMEIAPDLVRRLKRLRLGGLLPTLPDRATHARQAKLSPVEFLELLLQDEIDRRDSQGLTLRVQAAGFDEVVTADELVWDTPVHYDRTRVRELFPLDWLAAQENVIFCGPVGVGKSWFAEALGYSACRAGHRVRFIKVAKLLLALRQARADHSFERELRTWLAPDLLILDDFGLRKLTAQESSDFYDVLVERDRRAATVITSNRAVDEWVALFDDPILANSALDRFAHRAHQIVMEGPSLRAARAPSPARGAGRRKTPSRGDSMVWPGARSWLYEPPRPSPATEAPTNSPLTPERTCSR
jgi:DNA replication protein DnaC